MSEMRGLRFDIFDRIRLSEETDRLERLDQIELIPHIEVLTEGEQALLKGHLQLTGQFSRSDVSDVDTLEHSIPVEITLPMHRIPDLNEVRIEIENFDIDLISPSMLNVTGVLSLSGIELTNLKEGWQDNEEAETVFVHQVPTVSDHAESQELANAMRDEQQKLQELQKLQDRQELQAQQELQDQQEQSEATEARDPLQSAENEHEASNSDSDNQPVGSEPTPAESAQASLDNERVPSELEQNTVEPIEAHTDPMDQADSMEGEAEAHDEIDPSTEQALKIAFTGRQEGAKEPSTNLNSLLSASEPIPASQREETVQEPLAEEIEEEESTSDGAEWKTIFLSNEADQQQFSSLRMCIVQREETIESIAKRYSLNPREIMLYNRIGDENLQEGQVLYIP